MLETWRWPVAIFFFAVLAYFATYKLIETPPTWFDEGIYLQAAINDSLHGQQMLQLSPDTFSSTAYVTGGFPFLKPISWAFSLFGVGLLQARIVMVGFILGCVIMFFLLARKLFDWRTALLSLAMLVTFPPLYGQGKSALGEVPGLFYLAIFLFALSQLERRKFEGPWWYVLAGLSAGLCVSTKPIFFLLGGAVLIVLLLQRRTIVWRWKEIVIAALAFLVPFLYWFLNQFFGTDSVQTVLSYYANPYAIPDLNAQMLTNALRFVLETSPLYFLALMLIWIASFVVRLYTQKPISIAESVAFTFAVLVWLAFLRTAGWYRYFFVAEVVALVFVPAAIVTLSEYLPALFRKFFPVTLVTVLVALQCYQLVFTSWVAVHRERTTSYDLQNYFATLPKESSFFVYNLPAAVIFLPSQNYYQYLEMLPGRSIGGDLLPLIADGKVDYLLMDARFWNVASSTYPKYTEVEILHGVVFARHP